MACTSPQYYIFILPGSGRWTFQHLTWSWPYLPVKPGPTRGSMVGNDGCQVKLYKRRTLCCRVEVLTHWKEGTRRAKEPSLLCGVALKETRRRPSSLETNLENRTLWLCPMPRELWRTRKTSYTFYASSLFHHNYYIFGVSLKPNILLNPTRYKHFDISTDSNVAPRPYILINFCNREAAKSRDVHRSTRAPASSLARHRAIHRSSWRSSASGSWLSLSHIVETKATLAIEVSPHSARTTESVICKGVVTSCRMRIRWSETPFFCLQRNLWKKV